MKRKKKVYDDDDGRVIAPMNVDGMPWYNKYAKKQKDENAKSIDPLSKKETGKLILHMYLAMIPVLLFFIGLGALFIWLLTKVWA